jgi:tripartite-type tricarboxylate transporter receptor subunit TctC
MSARAIGTDIQKRTRNMMQRRTVLAGAAGSIAALGWRAARAQLAGNAFVVSGFPPGGMGDMVARPLAEKLRGK